mgnify:CR=1 FL=1
MEKWTLLGWRHVEGTSSKTGNPYKGTSIYVSRESNGVTGQETEKFWVPLGKLDCEEHDLPIGQVVTICFNRYGGVESVIW